MIEKNITTKLKARIRKSKKDLNKKYNRFFDWIKGEIVELRRCDTEKDPVRPELDNEFRTSYGRKIYGVKFKMRFMQLCVFATTTKFQSQFMS